MIRLYLFVEGQTEQTFANNVLKPHLSQYGVFMHKPRLIAHARKKGKVHRGGGRRYQPMKDDILRSLKEDPNPDAFFTTMLDLYAIHPELPGLADAEKLRQDPMQRVKFLEKKLDEDINDRRFIPYIQLHEYEAYLFSDVTCFENLYEDCEREIAILKEIADKHETPEFINDRPESAPSKRIIAQFPEYERAKVIEGSELAELIGLDVIRSKCHHFNAWLSRLEALGDRPTD